MAGCGCGGHKAAECGCKGRHLEKSTREELIAALVTDKYSGFKEGDESMLGGASDARLEEFRSASEAHRKTASDIAKMEADQRQDRARLKVAEERVQKAEQAMSDEDFVARLSPTSPIKALLEARAAEEKQLKDSLVNQLKDLGGETEEQLKKKPLGELQTLVQYARVKVLDFSGRGVAVNRAAEGAHTSFAPPDPYKPGLEALRAVAK